jgi:hypothetical protein
LSQNRGGTFADDAPRKTAEALLRMMRFFLAHHLAAKPKALLRMMR